MSLVTEPLDTPIRGRYSIGTTRYARSATSDSVERGRYAAWFSSGRTDILETGLQSTACVLLDALAKLTGLQVAKGGVDMQNLTTMQQQLTLQRANTGRVNSAGAGATCRPVASFIKPKLAVLDPTEVGTVAKNVEKTLRQAVSGHDAAIHEIVKVYQTHLAGLRPAGRPIGAFLFLGPTGSGRQQMVEAVADALLGSSAAVVRAVSQTVSEMRLVR